MENNNSINNQEFNLKEALSKAGTFGYNSAVTIANASLAASRIGLNVAVITGKLTMEVGSSVVKDGAVATTVLAASSINAVTDAVSRGSVEISTNEEVLKAKATLTGIYSGVSSKLGRLFSTASTDSVRKIG